MTSLLLDEFFHFQSLQDHINVGLTNLLYLKRMDRLLAYTNSHEELVVVCQCMLSGKMMRKNPQRVQGAPISCDLQKLVSWLGVLVGGGRDF